jgi:hypothetical protein
MVPIMTEGTNHGEPGLSWRRIDMREKKVGVGIGAKSFPSPRRLLNILFDERPELRTCTRLHVTKGENHV